MSSDDNDKSTKQVLEYYKKYSQNRNLPKYFSGTSVSYLPPITSELDNEPLDLTSQLIPDVKVTLDKSKDIPANETSSNASSTESPSEHKKLEWDNGADIGYDSARRNSGNKLQLTRKSSSLPILVNLKDDNSNLNVPKLIPSTTITHSGSNENLGVLVFSSSSSSNKASLTNSARQDSSTDTKSSSKKSNKGSSSDSDDSKLTDFQRTIDFLKQKIGLPGAHSTPNIVDTENNAGSSLGSKSSKLEDGASGSSKTKEPSSSQHSSVSPSKLKSKQLSKSMQAKIIELSISTPINVNCNRQSDRKMLNEFAQKAVQTESVSLQHRETQINLKKCNGLQQKLVSRADSVSISDDSASSFEYISVNNNVNAVKSKPTLVHKTTSISGVLKEATLLKSTTESSNMSRSSSEDIDRHLEILQKLFKTKKLNTRTKRKYIKKLLKELCDLETSTNESSTSSELFVPRKDNAASKPSTSRVVFEEADDFIRSYNAARSSLESALDRGDSQDILGKQGAERSTDTSKATHAVALRTESNAVKCVSFFTTSNIAEAKKPENMSCVSSDPVSSLPLDDSKGTTKDKKTDTTDNYSSCTNQVTSSKLITAQGSTWANPITAECSTSANPIPTNSSCRLRRPIVKDQDVQACSLFDKETKMTSTVCFKSENRQVTTEETIENPDNCYASCKQRLQHQKTTQSKCPTLQEQPTQTPNNPTKKCAQTNTIPPCSDKATKYPTSNYSTAGTSAAVLSEWSKTMTNDEYFLSFAENERNYQLSWINNEISHLSKLKNILESKSSRTCTAKTSVYNVKQKTDQIQSDRNYVIQTNVDFSAEQNVNYVLGGKEYVVSDNQKNSCSDSSSDKTTVDIKVVSDEHETNIQVYTLCSKCKQVVCVCQAAEEAKKPEKVCQENVMVQAEVCWTCQRENCTCSKTLSIGEDTDKTQTAHHLESGEGQASSCLTGTVVTCQQDFSSLQKVFKLCQCTAEKSNCRCNFVNKLLEKFSRQLDRPVCVDSHDADQKTCKDTTCQTLKSSHENKSQTDIAQRQTKILQCSKEIDCKCAQTERTDVDRAGTDTGEDRNREVLRWMKEFACKCTQTDTGSARTSPEPQGNYTTQYNAGQATVNDIRMETERNVPRDDGVKIFLISGHAYVNDRGEVSCGNKPAVANTEDDASQTDKCNMVENPGRESKGSLEEPEDKGQSLMSQESVRKERSDSIHGIKKPKPSGQVSFTEQPKSKDSVTSSGFKDVGIQVAFSFHNKTKTPSSTHVEVGGPDVATQEKSVQVIINPGDKDSIGKDPKEEVANEETVTSSATSTSTPTSNSTNASSRIICYCCKQKAFLAEVTYLHEGNDSLAVCSRCYYTLPRYCRHNPQYSTCRCWSNYYRPENQQYCNQWYTNEENCQQYCRCCRMDVAKCPRRPKALVYTLTLESGGSDRGKRRSSKSSIENIKVQKGWSSKKFLKDKENYHKKKDDRKNSGRKDKGSKEARDGSNDEAEKKKVGSEGKKNGRKMSSGDESQYTLMEYLIRNRPEFINAAEYRRQMLLNSRILREQQKDTLKLNFLDNNLASSEAQFKLFSEREMKDINRKNYKKLPEVQNKIINQRQKRLRNADRLISNIFAKKIQKSVLQGKGDFPIDKPVTNL